MSSLGTYKSSYPMASALSQVPSLPHHQHSSFPPLPTPCKWQVSARRNQLHVSVHTCMTFAHKVKYRPEDLHEHLAWHPPALAGMLWDSSLPTMPVKGPGNLSHTHMVAVSVGVLLLWPLLDPSEHLHTSVLRHEVLASPAWPSEHCCSSLSICGPVSAIVD